ncbi:MAG TPA: hypothetical protein VIV40_16370 [Kofleriaceae bacterium]
MRGVLVLALAGLVGCVPPPVYRVQRTARVPHPAAPLRTGEPLDGPVELSVGASSLGDVKSPELVDEQASLEVPREQMRGELRIRLGKRGEFAPIFEQAMAGSMQALDSTQAPVKQGSPTGLGVAGRYSFETGAPGFAIGVGLEVMSWQIPYVEYRTCVANCEINSAPTMQVTNGIETVSTFGLALTPTYRRGPLALFAGAYTRRHPTIVRKGTERYAEDYDSEVDGGPYNWLVNAGLEYRLPIVSVLAMVQQNLTRDPVQYAPSFGVAIAFRVPDQKRSRAHAVEPAPTPSFGPPGDPGEAHDSDAELPDDPW